MSNKAVKKFMQSYRAACLELESLQEEHERIISMLYSLTSDPSKSGGTSGNIASDNLGDGVAQLIDHCKKIDEEIKRYIQIRDDVRGIIRKVMHHNIVWGQCLHHRYINGYHPTVVANEMGYEASWERRVHSQALRYVENLLLEEYLEKGKTSTEKHAFSMV